MHKVVVERPRGGQGWARQFPRPKVDFDDLPIRESIRRPHTHRKWFTDVLGPLRRWMHSQVGCLWNDVYSEACAVIKPDSVVRAHIKTHLLEFVQRHTFMQDGRVWCFTEGYCAGERPVELAANHWAPFYVHPETGLLCRIQLRQRSRWRDEKAERRKATQRWLTGTLLLRQIHGLWFACEMRAFPRRFERGESPWRFDLADRKAICRSRARDIYGHEVYCVAKRQLSRRELKHHSLANAPTLTRSAIFSRQLPCRLTISLRALVETSGHAPHDPCSSRGHETQIRGDQSLVTSTATVQGAKSCFGEFSPLEVGRGEGGLDLTFRNPENFYENSFNTRPPPFRSETPRLRQLLLH